MHKSNPILYNGKLFTQDSDFPYGCRLSAATAVAIGDGRFLAVGDDAEIRALARPRTKGNRKLVRIRPKVGNTP